MSDPITKLEFWRTEEGTYHGLIYGEVYDAHDPNDLLDVANRRWPHVLFKLEPRYEQK